MRFTEHNETPARRATSVFRWPAFNKISTSCRFNILSILLPPGPPRRTDRETHRKGFTVYGVSGMAQNFRNEMAQIFRNSHSHGVGFFAVFRSDLLTVVQHIGGS